jgi:signal transduction histidine kinase
MYAAGGYVLLLAPNPSASGRLDRVVVAWFWIGSSITQAALVMTSKPEWMGFSPSAWWFGLFASHHAFRVAGDATMALNLLVAIGFVVALSRRFRRMVGLDRIVTAPVYIGGAVLGVLASAATGEQMIAIPKMDSMYVVFTIGLIVMPLAFVGAALLRRLEHATVSQALRQAFADARWGVADIETALRETLRDPTLRLFVWSETVSAFIDGERTVDRLHEPLPGRSRQELRAPDGNCVAIIDIDVALEHHPSLVATASQVSAAALQNMRLHGDWEARVGELHRSRARLVEAAMEERRRIEHELHDDVQQRLLAVVARLGLLQRETSQQASRELAKELSGEIRATLEDLERLANGIHPPELRQFGLRSAIDVMAERLPLEIATNVADVRMSPIQEATLYFVAWEALTNVMKHASATKVDVVASVSGDNMILEVRDNGKGGADMAHGTGLTACDDRVRSIGGEFEISHNVDAGGTVIRARVPICE